MTTAPSDPPRRYTAPLVACALAAIVLAGITLVPGLLGYPDTLNPPEQTAGLPAIQQARIAQLRTQIGELETALDEGMCVADGQFLSRDGFPVSPQAVAALPSAPPTITEACAGAAEGDLTVEALVDRATVLIARIEGDTIRGIGTGFFIRPGIVLTNAHVVGAVGSRTRIQVYGPEFGAVTASVVSISDTRRPGDIDLAVLSVSVPASDVSILTFAEVDRGARIRAVGFPGHIMKADPAFVASLTDPSGSTPAKQPVIDSGQVVVKQNEGGDGTWIYHTAYTDRGNSGGPVVDICGRVVGVNTVLQAGATDDTETGTALSRPIAKAQTIETVSAFFRDQGLDAPGISIDTLPGED